MSTITMPKDVFSDIIVAICNNSRLQEYQSCQDILDLFAKKYGEISALDFISWDGLKNRLPLSTVDPEDFLTNRVGISANSVEKLSLIIRDIGRSITMKDALDFSNMFIHEGAIRKADLISSLRSIEAKNPNDQILYGMTEKVIEEISSDVSKKLFEGKNLNHIDVLKVIGKFFQEKHGAVVSFSEGRQIIMADPDDRSRKIDMPRIALVDLAQKIADAGMIHPVMGTAEVKALILRNVPDMKPNPFPLPISEDFFERTNTLNKAEDLSAETLKAVHQAPAAGGLDIDAKALSRIVDRVAEEVRKNPKATKSVLLNIVAAQIAGPGHDWGLVKNGGRSKRVENGATIPAVPVGPTLVGTHFSICDLPMAAFDNDPEKAADFLYMNRSKIEDAMSTAGNEAIRSCMIWDGLEWDPDDEDDTFSHEAWQEREVNVVRLGQTPSYMSLGPVVIAKEGDLQQVSWTEDRSQATRFSYRKASNMGLPENCALLPIAIAEPEIEAEPDFRP